MRSFQDQFIHEISPESIIDILQNGAWQTRHQSITSAETNDNHEEEPNLGFLIDAENTSGVNAFADIQFAPNTQRVLDVGGGQFDCNKHYLRQRKEIELVIWDPYNRSLEHNHQVMAEVRAHKVDAATSMSVLNVIPELETRLAHIATLKAALVVGGKAYFKIWPGEGKFRGSCHSVATESSYQANAFAERFLHEIEMVFGMGSTNIDTSVPNLIVATKENDNVTTREHIQQIQQASRSNMPRLLQLKERSFHRLYSSSVMPMLMRNFSFFNRLQSTFIEKHRHTDERLQRLYDQQYGLIVGVKPAG